MTAPLLIPYGSGEFQFGQLWLPDHPRCAAGTPLVTLIHGGFWRSRYGLDLMEPMAESLRCHGLAVWNIEYRRVGHVGGGWPGTGDDVIAAINHVVTVADEHGLDTGRHGIVGHSAGGHLTLWSALSGRLTTPVSVAVGLAPVADLEHGWRTEMGSGAIVDLFGATFDESPEIYRKASPAALLESGRPAPRQAIVQGTDDDSVPVDHVRNYVASVRSARLPLTYDEFDGVGHMEVIDPDHHAWLTARARLLASVRPTIVLAGFMGTGKSTIGAALAETLGAPFVDTDAEIEAEHGPIPEIFAARGEAGFRQLEREVAERLGHHDGAVIATGGGFVLDETVRSQLAEKARIFTLTAEPDEILRRVDDTTHRPLLAGDNPEARIAELLAERASVYDLFEPVATDQRSTPQIVDDLVDRLRAT